MNILSNCSKKNIFPSFHTKPAISSWSIAKGAALLTGIFLSYQFIQSTRNDQRKLINASVLTDPEVLTNLSKQSFYHCTKEENLNEIFSSGVVKISWDGEFANDPETFLMFKNKFHAYVSTRPEYSGYGRYALVFNENLKEREDGTLRKFDDSVSYSTRWTAFTEDLPINDRCFDKILFQPIAKNQNEQELERKNLETRISKVAGRTIKVEVNKD